MLCILAPTFEPVWHTQHHYSTCFAGTSQNNLPVFCHWVYCTLRLTRPSENPTPVPAQLYCFLKIFCTILTWQFEVTHSRGVGIGRVGKARGYRNQLEQRLFSTKNNLTYNYLINCFILNCKMLVG